MSSAGMETVSSGATAKERPSISVSTMRVRPPGRSAAERLNRRRWRKALRRKAVLEARRAGLPAPAAATAFAPTADFVSTDEIRIVVPPPSALAEAAQEADATRRRKKLRKAMSRFLRSSLGAASAAHVLAAETARAVPVRPDGTIGDRGAIRALDALGVLIFHGPARWEVERLEAAGAAVIRNATVTIQTSVQPMPAVAAGSVPPWHLQKINVAAARARGLDGRGITVGVLDTGVDARHPELAGREIDYAEFPEDGGAAILRAARDKHGHGTHVCALVSGRHSGVAPGARLRVAAVLTRIVTVGGYRLARGTVAQILAGAQWLITRNGANPACDVLNMSLGYDEDDDSVDGTLDLSFRTDGIIPVAAVGNRAAGQPTTPTRPGVLNHVLAAGASDRNDVAWRDNRAGVSSGQPPRPKCDILAPGVDVVSAWPDGQSRSSSGSSMASGILAGALALMLQKDRFFFQDPAGSPNDWSAVLAEVQRLSVPVGGGRRLDLSGI
jgi:serine protease AprX